MSVDQSGGLRMEIGVLCLSHAMLVIAELIVCRVDYNFVILRHDFFGSDSKLMEVQNFSQLIVDS